MTGFDNCPSVFVRISAKIILAAALSGNRMRLA